MHLSCLPVSFFSDIIEGRMGVVEWARMGSEIGLDAIDLSILFLPDRSLKSASILRNDIESTGMRVIMVTSYPDFTHPDPARRLEELELEQEVFGIASELGARYVRVTAGQAHPETGRTQGIAWAVEGLTRLVEKTREIGVQAVYENHAKPGAWTYTDFSQPPEIFLSIAAATAGVGLGINFDTGNATAFANDPVILLRQILPRLVTVHAADTATKGALQHILLGAGLTPFIRIFACLQQAGWDGWICMEEASNQGKEGVRKAASFIRRTWQEAI